MNVSLRSQMAAGVAVLGAAAVAVTPITQPDLLSSPQRVAAAVELSALVNPLSALGGVISDINTDILSQAFVPNDLLWPDDFYGVEFLYAPLNLGLIPDVVNQFSTGTLVGLVNNLSGYLFAATEGVIGLGVGVTDSVFNTPGAVVTAVGELVGGDPEAALNTLVTQIIGPLQSGLEGALASVGYVVDNVIENIQTVITSTIPFVASGVINSVVGGLTYLVNSAVSTVGTVVASLGSGQFEAAWNAAVNGFLGPDGTLGQIETLALGLGIVEDVGGEPTVVVPSLRSVLTSELQRLGGQKFFEDGGITNDPFAPIVADAAESVAEPAPAAALAAAPAPLDATAARVSEVAVPGPVAAPAGVERSDAEAESAVAAAAPVEVTEPDVTSSVTEAVEVPTPPAPSPAAPNSTAPVGVSAGPGERATIGTPKRSAQRAAGSRAASSGRLAN